MAAHAPSFPQSSSGRQTDASRSQFIEKLVSVNRVAKVHKGGKRMAFNALAIVGDGQGRVGVALGRANEASDSIRKGFARAQRQMVTIVLKGRTIPHEAIGHWDACRVLLKPASPGTGIIAGGPVRAVCEACGIRDILTKSLGSSNAVNLAKATLMGLMSLQAPEAIQQRRNLYVEISQSEIAEPEMRVLLNSPKEKLRWTFHRSQPCQGLRSVGSVWDAGSVRVTEKPQPADRRGNGLGPAKGSGLVLRVDRVP